MLGVGQIIYLTGSAYLQNKLTEYGFDLPTAGTLTQLVALPVMATIYPRLATGASALRNILLPRTDTPPQ